MPHYHVIIADDEDDLRALIARIVVRTYPAVTISAVKDGVDALRIFEQRGADLLITNNAMPQLGGVDLVRILRSRQVIIPIVMVSAVPTHARDALAVGVTCFVGKPFTIRQLTQALTSVLPP